VVGLVVRGTTRSGASGRAGRGGSSHEHLIVSSCRPLRQDFYTQIRKLLCGLNRRCDAEACPTLRPCLDPATNQHCRPGRLRVAANLLLWSPRSGCRKLSAAVPHGFGIGARDRFPIPNTGTQVNHSQRGRGLFGGRRTLLRDSRSPRPTATTWRMLQHWYTRAIVDPLDPQAKSREAIRYLDASAHRGQVGNGFGNRRGHTRPVRRQLLGRPY